MLDRLVHLLVWPRFLLSEHLSSDLFSEGINLSTQEGLDESVDPGDQPKNGVDKVQPNSPLLDSGAAALVRVIVVPVEEDPAEDSKHDDPQEEQRQVPGEEPGGLELVRHRAEWRCGGKRNGRHARERPDDQTVNPFGGVQAALLVLFVDAVAVESHDDQTQHELQASDDETGDVLPCLKWGCCGFLSVRDAGVGASLSVCSGVQPILEDGVLVLEENGEEFGNGHDYYSYSIELDLLARSWYYVTLIE